MVAKMQEGRPRHNNLFQAFKIQHVYRFAQEQGENYHAQATTSAFSTDNLIEEGMYEEEEEHDGHAMATSTAQ